MGNRVVRATVLRDRHPEGSVRYVLLSQAVLLAVAFAAPAAAQEYSFTEKEFASLPRYCKAQKFIHERNGLFERIPESERRQWEATLGPGYLKLHHFCRGLVSMQRAAQSRTSREERRYYQGAIRDFAFVQNGVSRDFLLLPEVYLRKGIAYRFVGEDLAAAKEFTGALRLKPDYTPAYVALIDYFLDAGELAEAERVLNTGLERVPSSHLLKAKQDEIKARRAALGQNEP